MRNMEKTLNMMLCKCLQEEQELYRRWLCRQMPEEILKHAAEYVMRENLLQLFDQRNLSAEQANALLQLREPLADLYEKAKTETMDDFWESYFDTIRDHAEKLARKAREAEERASR